MRFLTVFIALLLSVSVYANPFAKKGPPEQAGTNNDDLQTPADVIHPNIHQNNGPGNAACPHDDKEHCNNMHGIGNNPGQSGNHPNDDGTNGFANQLNNVHGGIGSKNKNVDDD